MKNLFFFLPIILLISCQSSPEQKTEMKEKMPEMGMKADASLMAFFTEVNVVKMHLFGTNEAEPNPENYPYTGKQISGDALDFLSGELKPNGVGAVYACYHTENSDHFILRVPGKNASSDLALAKWDVSTSKLVKIKDLAYLMCAEGTCEQQDAWLTDLDDSRTLELVVRKHIRDAQGNISNESFTVLTDDGSGNFIKTNKQLASLAPMNRYIMQ